MIARILIDKVWVSFYEASLAPSILIPPGYPFLHSISSITESTSAESGSASFVLALDAYPLIGIPLEATVELIDKVGEVLFIGTISDIAITSEITVQLEA